jgi:hypothetical protein
LDLLPVLLDLFTEDREDREDEEVDAVDAEDATVDIDSRLEARRPVELLDEKLEVLSTPRVRSKGIDLFRFGGANATVRISCSSSSPSMSKIPKSSSEAWNDPCRSLGFLKAGAIRSEGESIFDVGDW